MKDSYPFRREIPTRWADNDIYGHVNNVEYYAFFDTVINAYLIDEGGLDIQRGEVIGLCAESNCRYDAPVSFPDVVEAGMRVNPIGNSSVRYEIGLFKGDKQIAEGWFVHVFVDRHTRRPVPIPEPLRSALKAIAVASGEAGDGA